MVNQVKVFMASIFIVLSLFMLSVLNHEELNNNEFSLCDEGITFLKLDLEPEFESEAQAKLYLESYKSELRKCSNGI